MKTMKLSEIIAAVEAEVLHGSIDIDINNIVTDIDFTESNTLLFHFKDKETIEWEELEDFSSCAVMTSRIVGGPSDWGNVTVIKCNDVNQACL